MTSHLRRTLEAMQARQDGFRGGRGTQPGPGAEAEEAGAAVLAPGKGCWGPECWGWGGGAFAAAAGAGGGGTMARGADGGGAPPRNGGGCGGPSICARVLYYALVTFSCSRESPAAGSRESPRVQQQANNRRGGRHWSSDYAPACRLNQIAQRASGPSPAQPPCWKKRG